MDSLSSDEARLIAVRRAVQKFNNSQIVNVAEASEITAFLLGLLDIDLVEDVASEAELEYWLDGIIVGIAITRLQLTDVPLEKLPKAEIASQREFQTGVDPVSGEVPVRRANQSGTVR